MGSYTTKSLTQEELSSLVNLIRRGYIDNEGHKHRQNDQLATILTLQANLGCRIGDIVNMTVEHFEWDGQAWRLNFSEEKTKKKRLFIVPAPVKSYIDEYCHRYGITNGRLFTIGKQDVWKHLRAATAYLGLEEVSAHSFRKTAALRVYNDSDKDIALTSSFLLHSSPTVTLRYLQRPSKQMDEILSKSVALI